MAKEIFVIHYKWHGERGWNIGYSHTLDEAMDSTDRMRSQSLLAVYRIEKVTTDDDGFETTQLVAESAVIHG